jgi:WXXGXW repeat (2 copies)
MMQYILRPLSRIVTPAALLVALCVVAMPLVSQAQVYVGINISTAPPPLPYYTQPALATPGEIWQPGYWAWGPAGYYWVPGTWVMPPSVGLYWTPGYWGYNNGGYAWNNGYWGPSVGYYGGINYGFGYNGVGYVGGAWNGGAFSYNTAVTNVDRTVVHNTYVNRRIVETRTVGRASYNGPGGVSARPTESERAVANDRHVAPTEVQVQHAKIAAQDRNMYSTVNNNRPETTTIARPMNDTRALPNYKPVTQADRDRAAPVQSGGDEKRPPLTR